MLRDSFLLSAHRLTRSISTLIVTMLLARTLTIEEMGIYQLILIVTITVSSFVPFEMPTSFSYFFNKTNDLDQKNRVITNTVTALFFLGLLTFGIIIFGKGSGLFLSDQTFDPYVIWVGLWCFALITGSYLENLYVSTENAKLFSLFSLVYYFVYFSTVAYVIYSSGSLLLIVQLISMLETVRLISLKFLFIAKHPVAAKLDVALLKTQTRYTLAAGAVTAITVLNAYTDKVLVHLFYPIKDFAVFAIAAREIPFVFTITASVVTAMLPKLSSMYNVSQDSLGALALWKNTSKVLAIIIFPMFWILIFYHQEYISIIYSSNYLTGTTIFLIYLIKFPLGFTVFYTLLLISGKQKLVLKNTVVVVGLNLILSIIGIYIWGMYGVASATVLTAFLGAYLQQKDVCKVFNIKQKDLLPYMMIIRTFLLSGIASLGIFYLIDFLPIHVFIRFFIGGLLVMGITFIIALLFDDINLNVFTSKFSRTRKTA